jgi:hypothetical protein
MKKIKTLLILIAITAFGCDGNDDETTPDPTDPSTTQDGFTYNPNNGSPIFYETTNAYIEIDEDDNSPMDNVPDYYTFFFLNGRLMDNDANVADTNDEILFSINTSNFAALKIDVTTNSSLSTGIPPSAGNTYVADSNDSGVITGFTVNSSTPQTFINIGGTNVEFGEGDDSGAIDHAPATLGHSVTINAMNLNTTNPSNSTIDVDYTFVNDSGEAFIGHYEGTLGIIED